MRAYTYVLTSLAVSFIFLFGCGQSSNSTSSKQTDWDPTPYESVNQLEDVTMSIKEGTLSETGLTVVLENLSNKDLIYGEYFSLEKKIGEHWYQVPVIIEENYGFNTIGYNLTSLSDDEWEADWEWLYGNLDAGEYRIIKDILDVKEPGDYEKYILSAEFTIGS